MYTYFSRTVLESAIRHILFPGQTWKPTNVLEYTITFLEMAWYLPFDKDIEIYIYIINNQHCTNKFAACMYLVLKCSRQHILSK